MSETQHKQIVEPHEIANRMLSYDKELNLCKDYHFITLKDTKEIFWYDHIKGVYLPNGETLIEEFCKREVPYCSRHFRDEVIGHIKIATYADRAVFDSNPNHIVLANGVFDLQSDQLLEHSPEEPKRVRLPVKYDPTARCPAFLRFLTQILPDQRERTIVLEETASCLWRSSALQKSYMWVGEGANGKSTLHKVLHALLGQDNVSQVSLHSLITNRFAPAQIDNKLANIFSDISNKEITQTGIFKSIVSGDPIDVERKNMNLHRIVPFCKMFYSCNEFPEVVDTTDAFFRRWIITEFTQKFEGKADKKNLINELTTPEELSGILNFLFPIAHKLIERKDFSKSPTTDQIRKDWGERADHVKAFIAESLEFSAGVNTPKADVHNGYLRWCECRNFKPKGHQVLTDKIKLAFAKNLVEDGIVKVQGHSVRVWKGIRLKVTDTTDTTPFLSFDPENQTRTNPNYINKESERKVTKSVVSVVGVTDNVSLTNSGKTPISSTDNADEGMEGGSS